MINTQPSPPPQPIPSSRNRRLESSYFAAAAAALAWFAAADMDLSRPAISVKAGRCEGSGDQHCSISLRHSGSQFAGTGGLSVLFTMPPGRGDHS